MLPFPDGPRKRRTRQHIIADQSVNHVERFIIDEGHIIHRFVVDYGYDLVMMTFDEKGYAEPGPIFLQLKASDTLVEKGGNYSYDLDIRDYNLWKREEFPVVLILFDAAKRRAYWVHVQSYFQQLSRQPRKKAKTIRVLFNRRQVLNHKAIQQIRLLKSPVTLHLAEVDPDV